jgi:hypothetical protein
VTNRDTTWKACGDPTRDEDCGHRHRSPDAAGRCLIASRGKYYCVRSSEGERLSLAFAMSDDSAAMPPVLMSELDGEVYSIFVGQYLRRMPQEYSGASAGPAE